MPSSDPRKNGTVPALERQASKSSMMTGKDMVKQRTSSEKKRPGLFKALSNPALLASVGGGAATGGMAIGHNGKNGSQRSLLSSQRGTSNRSLLSKGNSSRSILGSSQRSLGSKAASSRNLGGKPASSRTLGGKPSSSRKLVSTKEK